MTIEQLVANLIAAFQSFFSGLFELLFKTTTVLTGGGILMLALILNTGCTISTLGDGEAGFEISTKWVLVHRASQTTDKKSVIEGEVPSIEELIVGESDEPTVEPD